MNEGVEKSTRCGTADPKVSFILFAYKQSEYIEQAVRAVLAQDSSPLDIILSDDASPDDTHAKMAQLAKQYEGPHRVRVRRSGENRGFIAHVHDAVAEAEGDFVIVAAGDDISLPHRTAELIRRWEELGRSTAFIYSDVEPIDLAGTPVTDWGQVYSGEHTIESMAGGFIEAPGASSAFTRDLIDRFPPMSADVIHEDRVLPFRAALLSGVVSHVPKKLVRYRVVGGVSRTVPRDLHDYLHDFSARAHKRILPDARQRLADLDAAPERPDLQALCRRAIVEHEARIEMATTPSRKLELALIKFLWRGAKPLPLIQHYLKFRLKPSE
jgi:glycosyltransferase involved in cell wall biosynthesis